MSWMKPYGSRLLPLQRGEVKWTACRADPREVFAHFPSWTMKVPTIPPGLRWLLKLAYHRGPNPKKPLPGPLFDLSVVGLFLFLAIGYQYL